MPGAKYVIYNMPLSMKSLEGGFLKPHGDGDLERGLEPLLQAEERDIIAKTACLFSQGKKSEAGRTCSQSGRLDDYSALENVGQHRALQSKMDVTSRHPLRTPHHHSL